MKKFIVSILSLLICFSIAIPVFADTNTDSKDSIVNSLYSEDISVESADNKFIFQQYINDNSELKGDLFAAGYSIDFTGKTDSDIIALANNIYITSENVGGSIRAAAATINISAKSVKNITAAGSSILVNTDTNAKGIYLFAGSIDFYGTCEDLYLFGDDVYIDGTVTGNVKINASTVKFGKNAKIDGSIDITASEEPSILGNIDQSKMNVTIIASEEFAHSKSFSIFSFLTKVISSFILGALLILICKQALNNSTSDFAKKPWLPFVAGLGTFTVLPVAALFICLTYVGIPISVISLIIYGIVLYLAPVIAGIILGNLVLKDKNIFLRGLTGIFALRVLIIIPYFGEVVWFVSALLALGVITLNIINQIGKNAKGKTAIQ